MSDDTNCLVESPAQQSHILGRVTGETPGPTLVVMTGIHGNEIAGVEAARRVLAGLRRHEPTIRGDLALLVGNLAALEREARFVDLDLNRQWTPEKLSALPAEPDGSAEPAEFQQQRELLDTMKQLAASARGTVHFMDLHTSSAEGAPFITVGDTMRNRRLAYSIPLPLILGLEEQVDGALLELLNNHGFVTMGVEAGKHDAPESIDYHEAVLWIALVGAGIVAKHEIPDLDRYRRRLVRASRDVPPVVEVRRRHAITPEDEFRMEPGFSNFMPVRQGQLLAHDRRGPIYAAETGRILLPLYQGQGDDGFFLCREVRPFWLKVSAVLRRLRVGGIMRFLPGVRQHPRRPEVLIVNTRVARIYPLEIFHLLGFRKVRENGSELLVSRRLHDLVPPPVISLG